MDKKHGKRITGSWRRDGGNYTPGIAQSSTQKSSELESPWPWWYTLILVIKISGKVDKPTLTTDSNILLFIGNWLALELNKCLEEPNIPEWMTTLIQKDTQKGNPQSVNKMNKTKI